MFVVLNFIFLVNGDVHFKIFRVKTMFGLSINSDWFMLCLYPCKMCRRLEGRDWRYQRSNQNRKSKKNRQHNVQKNRDKQRSTYEIKDAYPFRTTWANCWPVVRFKKQCFKLPLTTLFHCNVPMLLPSINPSTFNLFFFVLCTLLCQFLWIVHLLRLAYPIVPVSLDCPFFIGP